MSNGTGRSIPDILYEDNHLLVVNKPAGILTQSDQSGDDSLLEWCRRYIRDHYRKLGNVFLGMVHRLDRPVCGVIVFARTSKAASRLSGQIRLGEMEKIYRAVVEGRLEGEAELSHLLVRRGSQTVPVSLPESGSQQAVLRYAALESAFRKSLTEITLITGRKHQIRAQMSAIGHPILGDRKYGSPTSLGPDRIALMCRSLSFHHPTRDERLTFTVPEPGWWPWP
ncbi:MAG: RluA family pseudouridine synthase [Candidatus Latescibacterota bacterium]